MQKYRIKGDLIHCFEPKMVNKRLTIDDWQINWGINESALEEVPSKPDVIVGLKSCSDGTHGYTTRHGGHINLTVRFPNDTAADFDLRTENNLPEELIKHIESFFNPPKDVEVNAIPKEECKRPFKVGDRVKVESYGTVVDIESDSLKDYPIVVRFDGYENTECYTKDGQVVLDTVDPADIKHADEPKMRDTSPTPQEDAEFAMWLAGKYRSKANGRYEELHSNSIVTFSRSDLLELFEKQKQSKAHPHQESTNVTLESFIEFASWVRSFFIQIGDKYAEVKPDFSTKYTLNQLYDKWLNLPQS